MITYADVQRIYRTEGKSPILEEVPQDFYAQISKLVSKVEPEHKNHIIKFFGEIYIKRRNKIILHAMRICDKSNPPLNATPSEKQLYTDAVDLIKKYSDSTLLESLTKRQEELETEKEEEKIKVRILKPMPSIVGSDLKSYGPFKEDDVLELPESNALLLIKHEFAEEFKEVPASAPEV